MLLLSARVFETNPDTKNESLFKVLKMISSVADHDHCLLSGSVMLLIRDKTRVFPVEVWRL